MCRFKIDLYSCRFIVNAYMPVTCVYAHCTIRHICRSRDLRSSRVSHYFKHERACDVFYHYCYNYNYYSFIFNGNVLRV